MRTVQRTHSLTVCDKSTQITDIHNNKCILVQTKKSLFNIQIHTVYSPNSFAHEIYGEKMITIFMPS